MGVKETIDTLWGNGRTVITANPRDEFVVVFSRPHGFFDLTLANGKTNEPVGFITLKHEEKGLYYIVNDTKLNPHQVFSNNPGDGIEVHEKYRKRGIGGALLSLGIGIVQRDYRDRKEEGEFTVVASRITDVGIGCYKNFGFAMKQGLWISSATYTNPDFVPELAILRNPAGRFTRFKKRLF